MKLTELLAIYTSAESTDEQKQAALAAYEEANKPADNSELETKLASALESIEKLEGKNQELLTEKQKAKQKAEEAEKQSMSAKELEEYYEGKISSLETSLKEKYGSENEKLLNQLKEVEINRDAMEIAAELCDKPKAMLPHLLPFFGFEVGENGFEKFFKDADGKRTAMKREELIEMVKGIDYLEPFLKSDFTNKGTVTTRTEGKTESQNPAVQNYLSAMNQ